MADSTLVMPASACWTLLAFGICTGTVVGALPGLLEEGPLGKEALSLKQFNIAETLFQCPRLTTESHSLKDWPTH